jgi:hypothetical protein
MGKRLHQSDQGQGLVEFAFVLPVLLLVVLGVIDFSRVMVIYAGTSNGAREAVRYGAVPGKRSDNSYNFMDCDIMRTLVRQQVPLMNLTDQQIWIGFDHGQGAPSTWYRECGALVTADIVQGDRIVVHVTAEVNLITPVINNIVHTLPVEFTAARTIVKDGIQTGPTQTPWPTRTPAPATNTPLPPTATRCQHSCDTDTPAPPPGVTDTPAPPTATSSGATATAAPPSDTPRPTSTRAPSATPWPSPTCDPGWPPGQCNTQETATAWATQHPSATPQP